MIVGGASLIGACQSQELKNKSSLICSNDSNHHETREHAHGVFVALHSGTQRSRWIVLTSVPSLPGVPGGPGGPVAPLGPGLCTKSHHSQVHSCEMFSYIKAKTLWHHSGETPRVKMRTRGKYIWSDTGVMFPYVCFLFSIKIMFIFQRKWTRSCWTWTEVPLCAVALISIPTFHSSSRTGAKHAAPARNPKRSGLIHSHGECVWRSREAIQSVLHAGRA